MASTTFSGPVTSTNGFVGDIQVSTYTVATLPAAASANEGTVLYASDALKASETTGNGTGNLVFSDGSNWIRVDTGATASA
jgi:hypothetical protein